MSFNHPDRKEFDSLTEYWNDPLYLRVKRGHHFLYHISSLAMCLLVLVKAYTICSTWSAESSIDWVICGIVLSASQITHVIHNASFIPAHLVSIGAPSMGPNASNGEDDGAA